MSKVDTSVANLVEWIKSGELTLPEMQRRYIWPATRVRDLFDFHVSQERGFLPISPAPRVGGSSIRALFGWPRVHELGDVEVHVAVIS